MDVLRVKKLLDAHLQREIPAVKLFIYPTINKLAAYLAQGNEKTSVSSGIRERAQKRRQQLSRRTRN